MRKPLILLALASVAAIVACNKTQLIQPPPEAEAITFRPLMNGMTKATPKTGFSENETINVWATMGSTSPEAFFNGVTFTYKGSGFTSTPVYYWPSTISAENSLNFYASSAGVVQTAAGIIANFSPDDAAASQVDLLVSMLSVDSKPSDGSATGMNFKHALSQIEVQAKNTNSSAVTINITGVKLGYIAKTGSCDFTDGNPVWSFTNPSDQTAGYTQEFTSTALTGSLTNLTNLTNQDQDPGGPWMIIPQNVTIGQTAPHMVYTKAYKTAAQTYADGDANLACAYVALELAFYNAGGSAAPIVAKQWCYWPISINLLAGNKYTFVIDAATGGYQPGNTASDSSTTLDEVLAGLAIRFSSPSISVWVNNDPEEVVL